MTVFIVGIRRETIDTVELGRYLAQVHDTSLGSMRLRASTYGQCEVLEGDPAEGVTIVEFPSREAALAWFHSDAYQAAARHRRLGAEYQILLVDAMPDPIAELK